MCSDQSRHALGSVPHLTQLPYYAPAPSKSKDFADIPSYKNKTTE